MPRAKDLKLKDALKRHQGVDQRKDFHKKQQKKSEKQAEKRKRSKADNEEDAEILEAAIAEAMSGMAKANGKVPTPKRKKLSPPEDDEEGEGWETEDDEEDEPQFDVMRLQDSDTSDSEDEEDREDMAAAEIDGEAEDDEEGEEDEDEDEDIPLSDLESLASADKEDVIPHQRLTINNHAALLRAHKSIALPSTLPWSAVQSITSAEPTVIADIEDDLGRELSFYKQALDAVSQARTLLKADGIPFSRPADYFAEMVKSDEHMGKIKKKLVDEAAGKKAAADARRQRDLRKFGKQVQVAKLQEREKAKRDTMDKINLLKRKRQGADISNANEEGMFDVALEDAAETDRKDRADRRVKGAASGKPGAKRQKRDEKYGFGGKKRFAKSNDAKSSADMSEYSHKKMKGKKSQRPGKSRRSNKP